MDNKLSLIYFKESKKKKDLILRGFNFYATVKQK